MNTTTKLYSIHVFTLIDEKQGFQMENRRCFLEEPYSVSNDPKTIDIIHFVMPLKYWDPQSTYFENTSNFSEHEDTILTETGIPKMLFAGNMIGLNPLQLINYLSKCDQQVDTTIDPDKVFLTSTGKNYVSW